MVGCCGDSQDPWEAKLQPARTNGAAMVSRGGASSIWVLVPRFADAINPVLDKLRELKVPVVRSPWLRMPRRDVILGSLYL